MSSIDHSNRCLDVTNIESMKVRCMKDVGHPYEHVYYSEDNDKRIVIIAWEKHEDKERRLAEGVK